MVPKVGATLVACVSAGAFAAAPAAKDFRFRDLNDLVDPNGKTKLTTIEAVLPKLSDRLRQNFTFVRDSDSLQGASDENPRAILFGDDGRFLVAFNGDKNQGGFYKLETIEATDAGPLEFREITFYADGKTTPKVSEANPKRCLQCHGHRSGYRWSGYSKWPGLFGDDDDGLEDSSPYAKKFDDFRAAAGKHPRYGALVFATGEGNGRYPYWSKSAERNLDHMPNTRLSKVILRNEARARVALIRGRDWYRKARAGWAFAALQCEETVLDEEETQGLGLEQYAAVVTAQRNGKGPRDPLVAARTAALADTAMHADYTPPSHDGTDNWDDVLDSAMLTDVATDFPAVAEAMNATVRLLVEKYQKDLKFAGNAFRPAALDALLLVRQMVRGYDDDFFFDDEDDEVNEWLAERLRVRRQVVRPACDALAAHFSERLRRSLE